MTLAITYRSPVGPRSPAAVLPRDARQEDGAVLNHGLADVRPLFTEHPLCEFCQQTLFFTASLDHRIPIGFGKQAARDNLAVVFERCDRLKERLARASYPETPR